MTNPPPGNGDSQNQPQDPFQQPAQPPQGNPQQPPSYPTQGQPPYAAYGPGGMPAAPPQPQAPSTILNAVKLMYAGAAIAVISVIFGLSQMGGLKDEIAAEDPSLTAAEVDAAYGFSIVLLVGLVAIGVGLWVWMAIMNGKGRGWARVVATVLGSLNALLFLIGLSAGGAGGVDMVLSLASVAVGVTALVLMYRPESSSYYNAVSTARRGF